MNVYGIFAGGGVKGAALAGALAAAQEQGVRFVGFGGTSAGSMVALLAAAGYSGAELGAMLLDYDFRDFLDDKGRQLEAAAGEVKRVTNALRQGGCWAKLRAMTGTAPRLVNRLGTQLGMYSGEKVKEFLLEKIQDKNPELRGHTDITFDALEKVSRVPVKIVASDITARQPALFSKSDTKYGASVIDAVRASIGYPFVFQPVIKAKHLFVDGGLSSNLPAFLFADEYRETRVPALAFDLIAPPGPEATTYDVGDYASDLMTTALEASDILLRKVLRGVHYVPIETPKGIDTLDFAINRKQQEDLFKSGADAANRFLAKFPPMQRIKLAGPDLIKQLISEYGPPQRFGPVLHAIARELESITKARDVRVHIMLPTGRPKGTRITVYQYGMDRDADVDLELAEDAGCSGRAWTNRTAILADLESAARNPEAWGMTAQEHAKVPSSRKSMMSVPVHRDLVTDDLRGELPPPPVATLSADSSTPLRETGWMETTSRGELAHAQAVDIMMRWAYILHRLLTSP